MKMWLHRRILRISWMTKISNTKVLEKSDTNKILRETVIKRKTRYFGYLTKGSRYKILQLILQGKTNGKRGPGKKKTEWNDNIKQFTNIRSTQLSVLRRKAKYLHCNVYA